MSGRRSAWVPVTWRHGSIRAAAGTSRGFRRQRPRHRLGREILPQERRPMEASVRDAGSPDSPWCPVMPRRGAGEVGAVDAALRATRLDGPRPQRRWRCPARLGRPARVPMIFLKQFRDLASPTGPATRPWSRPTRAHRRGAPTRTPGGSTGPTPPATPSPTSSASPARSTMPGAVVADFDFEMDAGTVTSSTRRHPPRRRRPRAPCVVAARGVVTP